MSYTTTILKNGSKQKVYTGSNTEGLLGSKYNGQSTSIEGGIYRINMTNHYNLCISLEKLNRYATVKSVKLRIYTPTTVSAEKVIAREVTGYSSNDGLLATSFKQVSNTCIELDVAKMVVDNPTFDLYLSIIARTSTQIYTDSAEAGKRPELIIEYIDSDQGLINQQYVEGSVGERQQYGINVRTGQPIVSKQLLELGGTLKPLNLTLEYNGIDTTYTKFSGMPKGWKFNYHQRVYKSGTVYFYVDSVGNEHRFMLADNATNIYYDISGTGLILESKTDGTFVIFDCNFNYLIFNQSGYLVKIEQLVDRVSTAITIAYNSQNQITSITDGMNRTVSFVYDTDKITITGLDVKDVVIHKNTSTGFLDKVTELDNRETIYSFDTAGMLLSSSCDNGELVNFTYDGVKRVTSVTNCVNTAENILSKETFIYHLLTTYVTNYQNVRYAYTFDGYGEPISVSEINSNNDGLIKSVTKDDFETYEMCVNKEEYLYFPNITKTSSNNTAASSTYQKDVPLSKGSIDFNTTDLYVLSFTYKISGYVTDGSTFSGSLDVLQNSTILTKVELDSNVTFDKNVCVIFASTGTTEPKIRLNYQGNGEVFNISKIRIYRYDPKIEKVCINYNTGSGKYYKANNRGWYPLEYDYTGFVAAGNIYSDKMYKEDLIENLKNDHISEYSNFVWYNKKRGLVVSDSTHIRIGSSTTNLSSIRMALVNEIKNGTFVSYNDYFSNEYFRKEYKVYLIGDAEFVLSDEIDKRLLVTKSVDNNGVITNYTYDDNGNVTSKTVESSNKSISMCKQYVYDNANFLTSEKDYINGTTAYTSYTYNQNNGKLETVTDPSGLIVSYQYDEDSGKLKKLSTTVDSTENANELEFDKDLTTNLKGNEPGVTISYDRYNLPNKFYFGDTLFLEKETEITTSGTNVIDKYHDDQDYFLKKETDKYGRVVKVTESLDGETYSDVKTIIYSDLPVGDIDSISDPNSSSLKRSSNSKVRKIEDGIIGNTARFYYNQDGNLERVTNSDVANYPVETKITYDNFDRASGKEISVSDGDIINTTVVYENEFDDTIKEVASEYKLVSGVSDDSLETITYDVVKCKLTNEKDNLQRIINKSYEFSGDHTNKVSYEYMTEGTNIRGTNTTNLITGETYYIDDFYENKFVYAYDNNGRIISIHDGDVLVVSYEYDLLGRIIRENNSRLNKTYLWTYDKNGNITSRIESEFTENDITSFTVVNYEYSTEYKDVLTKYGNTDIITSEGTVVTSYGDAQFQWNRDNKLRRIDYTDGRYLTFEYDADGRRTSKVYYDGTNITTHIYTYDGNKIIKEKITSGTTVKVLDYLYVNDEIAGFVYNQQKYFFIKNFRNDILGIVDINNDVVARYEYDAWGKCLVLNPDRSVNTSPTFIGNINPFRYRGYYYDVETGLFMVGHRYYNPEWGRWLSPDDIEYLDPHSINGLNLYAYCNNDPVNKYDPTGHFAIPNWLKYTIGAVGALAIVGLAALTGGASLALGAAVGAGVGAGLGFASGVTLDENGLGFDADKAASGFMFGSITGAISGWAGAYFDEAIKAGSMLAKGAMALIDGTLSLGSYLGQTALDSHISDATLGGVLISLGSGLFSFADRFGGWLDDIWGPTMGAEIAWVYDILTGKKKK